MSMIQIALSRKNLVAISFCSFSKKRVKGNCLQKCMEVNTKYSKNNKFNKDKSCKKNLLANFCLNYSNRVKTIINWNKLKLKKQQYQKLQQKKPRRCCDWLFFSSGRFVSQFIVNPINRFLGTCIMIVSFLGSATCMLTQLNLLLK